MAKRAECTACKKDVLLTSAGRCPLCGASLGAPRPAPWIHPASATALVGFVLFAVGLGMTVTRPAPSPWALVFLVGLVVFAIGMRWGIRSGMVRQELLVAVRGRTAGDFTEAAADSLLGRRS